MSQVAVSTPFNIQLEFEVAPFYRRMAAWFADIAVMLLYARGMKYFVREVLYSNGGYSAGVDFLLVSMPLLFYHLVVEISFNGQSLGKRLMGIRVMSLEGGEPRLGQYLLRWVFRIWEWPLVFGTIAMDSYAIYFQLFMVMLMGIGVVIAIAVSTRSQRLGDLAAGTTVVDLRSHYGLADTVFKEVEQVDYQPVFPEVMRLNDRDINAIQSVLKHARKTGSRETAERVTMRIKEILHLQTDMDEVDFLEQLLHDYNYLATKTDA